MANYCLITSTFDNKEEADKVRDLLLEKKLIASGGITYMNSKRIWKGKIEQADEYYLQMLTQKESFNEIKDLIEKMHSYETCGILMYDILQGNSKFLELIEEETKFNNENI